MHIANRMPSSSIRVDSARISAERRLPLSDGRVRSKFQFDAEASRIQSSVCGGSLADSHVESRRTSVSTRSATHSHRSVGEFVFLGRTTYFLLRQ